MKIMQKPRNPLRIQKRKGVRVKKKRRKQNKWESFLRVLNGQFGLLLLLLLLLFFNFGGGGEEGVINVACYTSTV